MNTRRRSIDASAARRGTFLAAAAAIACAACADIAPDRVVTDVDSEGGEIAIEFTGPNDAALIVPVHINGEGPFDMVLDTGATITCLAHRTAERLGLEAEPGAIGYGAGIGGSGRFELVRIDSMRIGTTSAHGLMACSIDLTQLRAIGADVDGLVGLNFLREFRMTLDFERNTLRLEAP